MRVFKFGFPEEKECPECNWDTSVGYVIARTKREAEEKEDFLCGNCLADILTGENYIVSKWFDPDDYPNLIFVQWLDKKDVEYYLGKKITDEEFQEIKEAIKDSDIADTCSEVIADQIRDIYESIEYELET